MSLISFRDWLNANESSPFTRSRTMAMLGLGPDIPDASLNSHSTAPPWMADKVEKKKKKKKKKKIDEAKVSKSPDYTFDNFIKKAQELHKLMGSLKPEKPEEKEEKPKDDKKKPEETKKDSKDKEEKPDNEIFKSKDSDVSKKDGSVSFDFHDIKKKVPANSPKERIAKDKK